MIQSMNLLRSKRRPAFTLVELLVVIAIIAIIGGLAAFFWPGFDQSERSSQGASNLHQWLLTARQRALLDQAPRGVRLFADPSNPQFFNKAQFLEMPDDFTGGLLATTVAGGNPVLAELTLTGADPTGGYVADQTLWPVQIGDFIQLHHGGLVHRITAINPDPNVPTGWKFSLASPLASPITNATANYKILRGARLQGDEPMDMPYGIAIDFSVNAAASPGFNKQPQPMGSPYFDVIFSPTGTVLFTSADKLLFLVRDSEAPSWDKGRPSIVAVYTQTGFIAGYDTPNPPVGDPFVKVR